MKQFYFTEITTKDKLVHQGIYFAPSHPSARAILYVHGLSGTFYGGVPTLEAFAKVCEEKGYGFSSFNNRGHDLLAGIKKLDKREAKGYTRVNGGAGQEVFEKCVFDINAGISYLVAQGFKEIILVGHSTGANKVCYYAGSKRDPRVVGVVLASPISDRLVPEKEEENRVEKLSHMKRLIDQGKGEELLLGEHSFPITPKRYVSLFEPHTTEDVFDYGEAKPKMMYFSRIRKPLMVIFGGMDEAADRPVEDIKKVFDIYAKVKSYQSVIIPEALHSFNGKEKEMVSVIFDWISTFK